MDGFAYPEHARRVGNILYEAEHLDESDYHGHSHGYGRQYDGVVQDCDLVFCKRR